MGNDDEILDWERLLGRWGDEESIMEIVPIFLSDNCQRLEKLREAAKAGDAEQIAMCAHALKGAGRNMEARRLSDMAGRLEFAAREGDMAAASPLCRQLGTEVERVIQFLSRADWMETAKRQTVRDR